MKKIYSGCLRYTCFYFLENNLAGDAESETDDSDSDDEDGGGDLHPLLQAHRRPIPHVQFLKQQEFPHAPMLLMCPPFRIVSDIVMRFLVALIIFLKAQIASAIAVLHSFMLVDSDLLRRQPIGSRCSSLPSTRVHIAPIWSRECTSLATNAGGGLLNQDRNHGLLASTSQR